MVMISSNIKSNTSIYLALQTLMPSENRPLLEVSPLQTLIANLKTYTLVEAANKVCNID